MDIINQIFTVCLIPLLGILTKYAISFLTAKKNELDSKTDNAIAQKYTDMIYNTVVNCVIATNQTYVDALKKEGSFDADAQKQAFLKTYNTVINVLSTDAKDYITAATGDLETYLIQLIEAEVNKNK